MDLYLIRHPAVAVASGTCYGRSDVDLLDTAAMGAATISAKLLALRDRTNDDATGRAALHEPGVGQNHNVPNGVSLSTSPLVRCALVAQILGTVLERPPVSDPRLAELDFGRWEGVHWDNVPRVEVDAWAADVLHARPHEGESVAMLAARTASWLLDLDQKAAGTTHIAMTHAGVIRVMTAQALKLPLLSGLNWSIAMTGICHLTRPHENARWSLRRWNV